MTKQEHVHEDQGDAVNWFKVLDVLVWVAVVVVVILGAEMLVGKVVRERIARDASRYLAKISGGQRSTDAT